jgi:hypothetical protein
MWKEGSGNKMKHPNEAALALHAGGDLGWRLRWLTARHVSQCEQCRSDVAGYRLSRQMARDLSEIPEIPWNRLAMEMKANIRLGLAAGDCVRTEKSRQSGLSLARPIVALASIAALLVTGLILEHPTPVQNDGSAVVQAMAGGVQVRRGERAFRLVNAGAQRVTYSSDAQGAVGAQSADPDTGYVTILKMYAE